MKIKKIKITDKIFLLIFDRQKDLAATFLRFQEFYESPKFHHKIFTLKEFKKWYTAIKGSFSYYQDWSGFNVPSSVLTPFFRGRFDPLTHKEKQLLQLFEKNNLKFYIIGISKNSRNRESQLKHEIAHGFFYTLPEYRKAIRRLLKTYDLANFKKELRREGGYCEDVLVDEIHAYALDADRKMKMAVPPDLKREITKIFKKYWRLNHLRIRSIQRPGR